MPGWAERSLDPASLNDAVTGLRSLNPHDIGASLLEIRGEPKTVADEEAAHERLRALATSVPPDLDMVSRYFLAVELRNQDLPEEASRLLEGYVDLTRPSPSTSLFLESLAGARRDAAFRAALAEAAPVVRSDPATLWTVAAHAWNLGDLTAAVVAVDELLAQAPEMFFVVEPDIALRKLDPVSWEPDHALVRAVAGLRVGERLVGPDGREGVVRQVRHKYVARLHYVMKPHVARFPEITGFKSLTVDAERPGAQNDLLLDLASGAQLRNSARLKRPRNEIDGFVQLSKKAFAGGVDLLDP